MISLNVQQLKPEEFERFRRFIYAQSGIMLGQRKISLLSNRIRGRLRACEFEEFDDYFQYLNSKQGSQEIEFFLDSITTNETSFFRTHNHYDWLDSNFIPQAVASQRKGKRPASLRIWSAACASGAEAYSIAITIEQNRLRLNHWSIDILGTDISESELEKARKGSFKSRLIENVDDLQRTRFFNQIDDESWQVKPLLQQHVRFKNHNLMLPMPEEKFDIVFLCNVLIYFDRNSKIRVLENITQALNDGGYLVIGPSEGVFDLLDGFEKVSTMLYQKPMPVHESSLDGEHMDD